MTAELDYYAAKAALEWQFELGVDEAIGDVPVNRYKISVFKPTSNIQPVQIRPAEILPQPAADDVARLMAGRCDDLEALRTAMSVFDHCALKQGARNMVFSDGNPVARVMIIGEAPGRDEDIKGLPFVGAAGQLLDKMFGAIGLSRQSSEAASAIYITNVMPWRPPHNREPSPEEIKMMMPFLERHIALAKPELLIVMGNTACQAVLGKRGITRLRGTWDNAFGLPVMPMFHPAALLRDAEKKRPSWEDLQAVKSKLDASK